MFNILVVEDDINTLKLICAVLKRGGYTTFAAKDGLDALDMMEKHHFDLIVLDLMMSRMDGYQLCKELRDVGETIPILMLTAQQEIQEKHRGFLVGTDDYMTKPFDEKEMLFRIKALLRRAQIVNQQKITIGSTTLDYSRLTVTQAENTIALPKKEFYLLFKLMSYPNVIFTRAQLMDEIWGPDIESDEHTLNVHMGRLREKLKDNPDFELVTVRGLGYKAVKKS
ncbi:heme response regulator [Clostridium aceticum]|uniref:Heme response regulator HssR n=1 Tax=Clostridium aceticum TaxID=84022 RepID=A0A0D8I5F1_9CLOT|nr:response regulator transcription factor [Clostridium aceticum]AKL96127.1 heme response regulator [Clostridium aceticum]KJF25510.1 heme response regulator HssR [Clostridium aceticum]